MDGNNYFTSGHVREVKVWVVGPNCRLLMARVNSSQSSPDNAHLAWIAVRISGDIIKCFVYGRVSEILKYMYGKVSKIFKY